jgi:sporulation protein YlmC with PRC-barrel domain
MRKLSTVMSCLLITGLIAAAPVFAAEDMGGPKATMRNEPRESGAMNAVRTDRLIGKSVVSPAGEKLGKVQDLIIARDGRVNFVVLARGGTLGFGETYVPVPFRTFMASLANPSVINTRNSLLAKIITKWDLIANLDKSKLDAAPGFSGKNWDEATGADKDFLKRVQSYYGDSTESPSEP